MTNNIDEVVDREIEKAKQLQPNLDTEYARQLFDDHYSIAFELPSIKDKEQHALNKLYEHLGIETEGKYKLENDDDRW